MPAEQTTMPVLTPAMADAHRQLEICNACRYCEGYCSVFPAMMRQTAFDAGDLNHMANLCHNCRGCYYSCQYAPPHAFALNLPAILAEVRQESWESYVRPRYVSARFHEYGLALSLGSVALSSALLWALFTVASPLSAPFYAHISHNLLVAVFGTAFATPLAIVFFALRSYWRDTKGRWPAISDLYSGLRSTARLQNLAGGNGQGCNFEKEDRYTNLRRYAHQAVVWGFMLCFLATASATVMHHALDWPAPYGLLTPPKLLGIPGGIILTLGTIEMIRLKIKADSNLGARRVWRGEMAFTALLGLTALSGIALYAATGSVGAKPLLALHLGCVLTLFVTMPFTKMVHGFFRMAALVIENQRAK